eukprot:TRINITY_DN1026_c0_g1_i1.p1 TRINITY_DN1026_c0_g1~~TRINITY_DN1026_c0_g1_i1.p1  ORF type:complete len:270 (-),score=43.57 TRINITY_DN1026_c0_g1_i1:44-811(-)
MSLPRFIDGTRNVVGKYNRKAFFGVGSHMYPRSRCSVGMWAVELWCRRHSAVWEKTRNEMFQLADYTEFACVRPYIYQMEDTGSAFTSGLHALRMPYDRAIVIHHDRNLELGNVTLQFGGRLDPEDPAMSVLYDQIATENFPRICVGVGHPKTKDTQMRYLPFMNWSDNHQKEWFLLNKFPDKEVEMIEMILMPVIQQYMEIANNAQSTADYSNAHVMDYQTLEETYEVELEKRLKSGLMSKEELHRRRLNPWQY